MRNRGSKSFQFTGVSLLLFIGIVLPFRSYQGENLMQKNRFNIVRNCLEEAKKEKQASFKIPNLFFTIVNSGSSVN